MCRADDKTIVPPLVRATPGGPRRLRPWRASDSCPRVSAAVSPFTKTQAHRAASANFFNTSSKWEALEMFLCGLWEAQLVALAVPVYRWLACLFKLCTTTATTTLWNSAPPFTPSSVVCIRVETPNPAAIALAASRTEPASPHAHCEKLSRPTFSATDFACAGIRCAFTGDLSGNSGSAKRRRCVFTLSFLFQTFSVLLPSALWSWASRWTSAPAARCQTRGKRLARLCFARC